MSAWNKLSYWLDKKLKEKNVSRREASLRAGLDHAAISRYINGTQPNVEACQKLAHFFGVPDKLVLELAGYFPPENVDEFTREISFLADRVPKKHRPTILAMLRTMIGVESETNSDSLE